MEIKSNVRQRRMDRMKQLAERKPTHPTTMDSGLYPRDRLPSERLPVPQDAPPPLQTKEYIDERWLDPEFVWKQRDRYRSEQAPLWTSSPPRDYRDPASKTPNWRNPFGGNQFWLKVGISAVLFALGAAAFRFDHPLALKGRQWVTTALTTDYNFEAARAWYASKFSGLPAVLPASWRRADPEAQKAATVNARQLFSPVVGKIVTPYTVTDPMMAIEPASAQGEAKAMDAGRVLAVTTGPDGRVQVAIQHADGLQSTYGGLAQTTLKKYDWIKGGEPVGVIAASSGNSKAGRLLFAVKKDNQWIDPTDVVTFD